MRYNSSGYYEEKLSFLGVGTDSVPLNENGEPDIEKCAELFKTAFEKGVTFFFVSPSANENAEKIFGDNLSSRMRGDYSLSGGIDLGTLTDESDAEDIFKKQLVSLRSGYFDYYIIENIGGKNFEYFTENHIYEVFSDFKKRGMIRHLGFSFSGTEDEWNRILNDYDWDFAKMDFNYYNWNHLGTDKLYHDLRKKNLPFIASDPFMGGLILDPPEEVFNALREGDPLLSMQEWALRWFFDKKGLLCIITNPENAASVSETADIISDTKTLNSAKKHFIKLAAQKFAEEKNAKTAPEE